MPRGRDSAGGSASARSGSTFKQRLSSFFLKPPDPTAPHAPVARRRTIDELEHAQRYADDKERLFGLIGAPVGGAIAIMITGALIANDPAKTLKSGLPNAAHVNPSLYMELLGVLLVLSVVMLATAWFRKRLFLGCAMALYGLAIFNLHYWGFGVPFVMVGAWLLVRAYRAQRDLKEASGTVSRYGSRGASSTARLVVPDASKRYTPPVARRRKAG